MYVNVSENIRLLVLIIITLSNNQFIKNNNNNNIKQTWKRETATISNLNNDNRNYVFNAS